MSCQHVFKKSSTYPENLHRLGHRLLLPYLEPEPVFRRPIHHEIDIGIFLEIIPFPSLSKADKNFTPLRGPDGPPLPFGTCGFAYLINLGGGFRDFYFHPYLGKISNLTNIFQMGRNHQLEIVRYHTGICCWFFSTIPLLKL